MDQQDTQPQGMPATEHNEAHASHNPNTVIIVVLAVIIVVLALMYMWGSSMGTELSDAPEASQEEMIPSEMESVSGNDAVPAIEAELDATDLDALGSELDQLEAELDAELNTAL